MPSKNNPKTEITENAKNFRDEELGSWSSHPHWLATASRWLSRCVASAVFVAYLAVINFWLRTSDVDGLRQLLSPGLILQIAIGLAFLVGFCSFASFQHRFALAVGRLREEERVNDSELTFDWPVIITTLTVGLLLPLLALLLPNMPFEARLLGGLLAFLPLLAIDAFLRTAGESTRFPIGALLLAVFVGLFMLLSFSKARVFVDALPPAVLQYFPRLLEPNGLVFAIGAIQFLLLFRFVISTAVWFAVPGREKFTEGLRRIFGLLIPRKKSDDPDDAINAKQEKPPFDLTIERLQLADIGLGEVSRLNAPAEACDLPTADSPWHHFFAEAAQPTLGQAAVLDYLHQSWLGLADQENPQKQLNATILVEGMLGSGRTTLLEAIALASALLHGRAVLFMVASRSNAKVITERLRAWSDQKGFGVRIPVGGTHDIVNAFRTLDQNDRVAMVAAWPQICVCTVADWQDLLFPDNNTGEIAPAWAKSLAQHYTVLLVDDWFEQPDAVMPALPFLLDQIHLLHSAACLPSVLVAAHDSLEHDGKSVMGSRLQVSASVPLQNFTLLPRQGKELHVAEIVGWQGEPITLLADMHKHLNDVDTTLRLWCPSARSTLRNGAGGSQALSARAAACFDHEQLKSSFAGFDTGVLAHLGAQRNILFLGFPDDTRRLALLLPVLQDEALSKTATNKIPLFVHQDSGFARHFLGAVLRLLQPGDAVPNESISRLGGGNPRTASEPGESVWAKLLADTPPDPTQDADVQDDANAAAAAYSANMVIMEQVAHGLGGSAYGHIVTENMARLVLERSMNSAWPDQLLLAGQKVKPKPEGLVIWKRLGNTVGYSQLQYLRRMVLEGSASWRPEAITKVANGIQVDALPFDGDPAEYVYPRLVFDFEFEQAESADSGSGWTQRVVSETCIGLYNKNDKPIPIHAELMALARWSGEERLITSTKFSFGEHATLFFVGPTEKTRTSEAELIAAVSAEPWSCGESSRSFLPALTQALHAALAARFGCLASYGRVLAFQLQGELREYALAVIIVLEPGVYGRTLSQSVNDILTNPEPASRFAADMLAFLRKSEQQGPVPDGDFWLPVRQRARASRKEIDVALALDNRKQASLVCSQCNHITEQELPYFMWHVRFECSQCNHSTRLVPTENNRYVCPASLVQPWWPHDVPPAEGDDLEKIMAVWQLVAEHVEYTLDHNLRENMSECWLSAPETWKRRRGDSEDHSILIASMLHSVGVKAWLVWGEVDPGSGHAWVEVMLNDEPRILEATAKGQLPPEPLSYGNTRIQLGTVYSYDKDHAGRTDGNLVERWHENQWAPLHDQPTE